MARAKAKPKTLHYHACEECKARYPDGCMTPKVNRICGTCASGRPSVHALGCEPRDCCRTGSRQTNKDDNKVYRLAGTGTWWICMECKRTFGFNPRSST